MTREKTYNIVKKIAAWAAVILVILLVLLLTATWFVNHDPFHAEIRRAIQNRLGPSIRFEQFTIALLPRPHLTLTNGTFLGTVKGSLQSAFVYPEMLPLLEGRLRLAKVVLDKPDLIVNVTEAGEPASAEDAKSAFSEARSEFESVVNSVRAVAPHFEGVVNDGSVFLQRKGSIFSHLSKITGTVSLLAKGFDVAATAEAPHWGRISLYGALSVGKNSLAVKDLSIAGGHSAFTGLSARFGWRAFPYLHIQSGQAEIVLNDLYERRALLPFVFDRLPEIKKMAGTVKITAMSFRGPLLHPALWQMTVTGNAAGLVIDSPLPPRSIRIEKGEFSATTKNLTLTNLHGDVMDSSLSAALSIEGLFDKVRAADVSLDGTIGRESVNWLSSLMNVPSRFILRAPLSLSGVHLTWKAGSNVSLSGTIAVKRGPVLTIEGTKKKGSLSIRKLLIRDVGGQASISAAGSQKSVDFTFRGSLNEITISRLFLHASLAHGWLRGALQGRISLEAPGQSTAEGIIEAGDLALDYASVPVTVKHLALHATRRTVTVDTGKFLWDSTPLDLTGTVKAAPDGFRLDMDLSADRVSLETLQQSVLSRDLTTPAAGAGSNLRFGGHIRFRAHQFALGTYTVSPVHGVISLSPAKQRITVTDAMLCGIAVPGTIDLSGQDLRLSFRPNASGQALEPALNCLFGGERHITGTYSFQGMFDSTGKSGELLRSLTGHIDLTAKDGDIFRAPILARIFGLLNVTEVLRGKLPDLGRERFKYKAAKITGDIKNGKLVLTKASLRGKTVNLAAEGEIDLAARTVDVTVLVAPFKTIEYILSKIPLLRNILANKLITIPVRVKGDLANPDITPLDPKAIGQNLLNIMKGILELPFKVLQPLFH